MIKKARIVLIVIVLGLSLAAGPAFSEESANNRLEPGEWGLQSMIRPTGMEIKMVENKSVPFTPRDGAQASDIVNKQVVEFLKHRQIKSSLNPIHKVADGIERPNLYMGSMGSAFQCFP